MVQPAERADARANRERLLVAAAEVFAERGLSAEMKEIAERAGVGIGTIYRNFPSKDDLIAAIVGDAVGGFERALEAALALEDPELAVRVFVRGGIGVVERYGGLMSVMLDGHAQAVRQAAFKRYGQSASERIAGMIAGGVRAGRFRADLDPQIAAATLMAVFTPWSLAALRRSHTPEQIADAFVDLFLQGALAPGA